MNKNSEYVPYESIDDFRQRMPDGLVRFKNDEFPSKVIAFDEEYVYIYENCNLSEHTFEDFLKHYTWFSDGSPCGKLKEDN